MDKKLTVRKRNAKKVGKDIKDALRALLETIMELDVVQDDGTNDAFFVDYSKQDMFNAASVFYFVCCNNAIKNGLLTNDNIEEKITNLRKVIIDTFGFDPMDEAQKITKKNKKEE